MKARLFTAYSLTGFILVLGLGLMLTSAGAAQKTERRPADLRTLLQPSLVATTTCNVELVSQIGGITNAVAVQGDYAYIGVGPRLVILDVSDPAHPTVVGRTAPLPGIVRSIYATGGYVYVAAGRRGDSGSLRVVDISDPAAPVEVSAYDLDILGTEEVDSLRVHVAGNYAYVVNNTARLHVVDVSDPTAPVEASTYELPGPARDIFVAGNYAYVAAERAGLRILDISTPT